MRATLNEKYSLAWLDMSTIVLFTLLGSLFYTLSHIGSSMTSSRSKIETVCESMNTKSEQILNAPSILLNTTMKSMFNSKENIHRNLLAAVSVLESCIVWLVGMYKSTYRCLLGLTIHTVLSLVSVVAEPLQKAAQGITSFFTGGAVDIGDWSQTLSSTQEKIDGWFKNDDDIIQQIVHQPFQLLQAQINETLNGWEPPVYELARVELEEKPCNSDSLIESLNHVEHELTKFVKILIGVLCCALVLCVLFNLWMIRFRHRQVAQTRALILGFFRNSTVISQDEGELLLDKYTTTELFPSLQKKKNYPYRILYFVTHPVAACCLITGLIGLLITLSLVCMIESKSQELYQEFTATTQAWSLDASSDWTGYASDQYQSMNSWISETEMNLNEHAFGVIKSTAITINDTLTNVVDQVHNLIESVLGGTPLEEPAKELTHCLLLTKIENIETGLTWIVREKLILITLYLYSHFSFLFNYR